MTIRDRWDWEDSLPRLPSLGVPCANLAAWEVVEKNGLHGCGAGVGVLNRYRGAHLSFQHGGNDSCPWYARGHASRASEEWTRVLLLPAIDHQREQWRHARSKTPTVRDRVSRVGEDVGECCSALSQPTDWSLGRRERREDFAQRADLATYEVT